MKTFLQASKLIWKDNNIQLVGLCMIILSAMNFLHNHWDWLTFFEFLFISWGTSYLINKPRGEKRRYGTACNKH